MADVVEPRDEPVLDLDDEGRPVPPFAAGEVATLLGFLDFQRATLEWKCRGLDDQALRHRQPPSSVSLGGLLRHLASVEDFWFAEVVAGQPVGEPWTEPIPGSDHTRNWGWPGAGDHTGEDLRALWSDRVESSRAIVAARLAADGPAALDRTHPAWDGQAQTSLRWVIAHMIEEYARHNGHADLLREAVDGQTGE
jgi:uncharacterized damage-inducible protein DinB